MDNIELPVGNTAVVTEPELTVTELDTKVMTLAEVEKAHILGVLTIVSGNKVKAAELLGVSVKTVYNKLHDYGILTTPVAPVKKATKETVVAKPLTNSKIPANLLEQLS